MDPGWHISSVAQPKGGPVPTAIGIPKRQPFRLAGPIKAPEPHKEQSAAFGIEVQSHEGKVEFLLPFEATAAIPAESRLAVEITYQACTDETCLLPRMDTVSAVVPAGAAKQTENVDWFTDYAAAQVLAARSERKLLLDFTGSDWCTFCIKLEQEVFTTAEFRRFAADYVLVRLDYPKQSAQSEAEKHQNDGLKSSYGITGYPTVILADATGRELNRVVGYNPQQGPTAWIARLTGNQAEEARGSGFESGAFP